jgi:hypothetical protein
MELQVVGEGKLFVTNLRDGVEVSGKRRLGELVLNDHLAVPFILQKGQYRLIKGMANEFSTRKSIALISVHCFDEKKTVFTKNGYVKLLLSNSRYQFWIYIHIRFLREFFGEICIETLKFQLQNK